MIFSREVHFMIIYVVFIIFQNNSTSMSKQTRYGSCIPILCSLTFLETNYSRIKIVQVVLFIVAALTMYAGIC